MNSQIQLVEEMIANFEDVNSRIETMDLRIVELENNNKELKRHINVIATEIAQENKNENNDKLVITRSAE